MRGLDPSSEIKGYAKRVLEGNAIKFKRDDVDYPLLAFADDALRHVQNHGLDSVFFMKGASAQGAEDGEELFTCHTKYSKSDVDAHVARASRFDAYGKIALKESAQWLLNSLDETSKTSLRAVIARRPTGPQLWMAIVHKVQADSLRRCKHLKKEFDKLSLHQFKGENVREHCKKASDILMQLERDNRLPDTHLLDIIDHLSVCLVMDFKVPWLGKRAQVEQFANDSNGKSDVVVRAMANHIHFSDLLEDAKQMHTNLLHMWGSGKGASESQALKAEIKALNAKLETVNQELKAVKNPTGASSGQADSGPSGNGKDRKAKCWNCGSEDHMKKNCPEKNKDKQNQTSGLWAAPKDGEPQEKVINGKTFKWCAKCSWRGRKGKWTVSHGTADHKDKSAATPAAANLCCMPVANQELLSLSAWGA
jgi:hypothetical protein